MKMRHTWIGFALVVASFALMALVVYSFERTSWLFQQYETDPRFANAAAFVIETAEVALIITLGLVAREVPAAKRPAERALTGIPLTQWIANLVVGHIRGSEKMWMQLAATTVVRSETTYEAVYVISGITFVVINTMVPLLIWWLSQITSEMLNVLVDMPSETPVAKRKWGIPERIRNLRRRIKWPKWNLPKLFPSPEPAFIIPETEARNTEMVSDIVTLPGETKSEIVIQGKSELISQFQAIIDLLPNDRTLRASTIAAYIKRSTRLAEMRRNELVKRSILIREDDGYRLAGPVRFEMLEG